MAGVNVSVTSDLEPAKAWQMASDLSRFDEWMTIFAGWKSPVPDTIAEGTKVSSLIKVKGFRNTIHWEVTRYDEPRLLELSGSGRGGVKIAIALKVTPQGDGSIFDLDATLSGSVLNGPIGDLVARVIDSDVRKSVANLVALR
ncbi:MAG: SRPBCC family protein [Gordonia sp.]|uniref:SRPBCC family protein n=1 Tax=Gordonia rubripertincta TaxID=36822 RepID=A0ABT4MWP3_GORRU|nr:MULTISPECIES: SRPBCC family protein [Mycobacteriales]MBA4024709.1 SRPBCC family protein [Gordonia sp. (in: high G+C Gram-positive bacteria)]MCZ4550162.1 SRPBCC family protein [Gordonia rubripertincta]OZG30459.1 polyketide cyclase / dehydrase and lipid transport [Williamsia sp. 1138]